MHSLDDFFQRGAATGQYMMSLPGNPAKIFAPPGWRPYEMDWRHRLVFGDMTPGVTFPSGTRFNMPLAPWFTTEFFCHELVHWWQANKRMGLWSYRATYLWHGLLTKFDHGQHLGADGVRETVHRDHTMEDEARRHGNAMAADSRRDWAFDTEAWLSLHLPALR